MAEGLVILFWHYLITHARLYVMPVVGAAISNVVCRCNLQNERTALYTCSFCQSADSPLRFFVAAAVAKVHEASSRRARLLRYLRLPASNEAEAAS